MDDLPLGEHDRATPDARRLVAAADKVHLDPALRLVPHRPVIERIQVKTGAEFPINSSQYVAVERRGHSIGVVVRWQEHLWRLGQISADDEQRAISQ